jgi:hypothetical protein
MSKLQSVGSVAGKETIYVDVDDEITAIIDKVRSAKGKVVALVLPKRATVLQSIVNMKLLKRTADTASKNLVLITTESGLMPLAGAVGLHVAATPNSRPEIPNAPTSPGDEPEDVDEPLDITDGTADPRADDFDRSAAATKSVGELAAAGAASKLADEDEIDESIDMSDDGGTSAKSDVPQSTAPKKNRKLAIPNFDSFRKKLALGAALLVLLIVGWVFAFVVLPKATVTISTDTSTVTTNLNLTLDTNAKSLDTTDGIVPATVLPQAKTATQQVPATGQVNNGDKATGTVSMTAKICGTPNTPNDVPVGTSVSASGHTYITQSNTSFTVDKIQSPCIYFKSTNATNIQGLKGGADYNLSSSSNFTVSGRSDVAATGTASGGTDNITKVVAQSDIDNATTKIKSDDSNTVKQQLISALQAKGLQAVTTTFQAGDPQVTTSAKAGDTADSVTVTAVTNYTMFGVKKQIDKGRQVILDNGVANAKFSQQSPATSTGANVSVNAKSVAGPHLDAEQLKGQIAGMKSGDVKSLVKQTPGVTDVQVKYSPFWVGSVPKKATKITIQIDKAGA